MWTQLIIVTGSNGFIGRRLINKLHENKKNFIIGIDNQYNENNKNENKKDNYLYLHNNIYTDNKKILEDINDFRKDIDFEKLICCHLAAKISVEESMKNPRKYYDNNLIGTLNILDILNDININNKTILFASTAAVYDPNYLIDNTSEIINPKSIYGHTKYLGEQIIKKYSDEYSINSIIFRFFNVAGGRDTDKAHHLIPVLIDRLLEGKKWLIFGNDYNTKDGTCVRDYIHVEDIANAFILSIDKLNILFSNNKTIVMNLGSNEGYSVKDIMEKTKDIINANYSHLEDIEIDISDRRPGDPDILISKLFNKNTDNPKTLIGWSPKFTINDIIQDTLKSYIF